MDAKVTTVLFNHNYDILYKRKNIYDVEKLTHEEYYVNGSTALLDAIGNTIVSMEREISNKVLFVITTDGLENSSIEFSKNQIKKLIKNHNWEFIFLGADIDAYSEASNIGIGEAHTALFNKSSEGINDMFKSVEKACNEIKIHNKLDSSWKEDLK